MINEAEIKEWNVIFPVYIDSKFTCSKGRRTIISNSIENPTIDEIKIVVDSLNIPCSIELNKRHPCDFFRFGRLRYKLKKENGEYYNINYKNSIIIRKNIIELFSRGN